MMSKYDDLIIKWLVDIILKLSDDNQEKDTLITK